MASKLYFDDTTTDFQYSVTLSNVEYILRFIYNSVSETWQMTVKSYDGTTIIDGVRLVTYYLLTDIYKSFDLPDGSIVVVQNTEGSLQTPSRYSFSEGTHSLLYLTSDEIDEITS